MARFYQKRSVFSWKVSGWVEPNPQSGQLKKFWNKFYAYRPSSEELEEHFKKHKIKVLKVTYEKIKTVAWSKL